MNAGFKRYYEEFVKLREDINKGFMLVETHGTLDQTQQGRRSRNLPERRHRTGKNTIQT